MVKRVKVEWRGASPLLMHRYGGARPAGDGDRKVPPSEKTAAWHAKIRKEDWMRSVYFDQGMFHIPPENVEAALAEAATKQRLGKEFKRAVMVEETFLPLIVYVDGDDKVGRPLKGKLEDFYVEEHIDVRGVVIPEASS